MYTFVIAEAPEEEYDPRSLYDRLQEQKMKKEEEHEEAHRLSRFHEQTCALLHHTQKYSIYTAKRVSSVVATSDVKMK